jgi:hypothetical protein
MATTSPTNVPDVVLPARRFLNTDGPNRRFRFRKNARRYTYDQMKTVYSSGHFFDSVITDKRGLVFSNFALAEAVNGGVARYFKIVRYSDMKKEDVRAYIQIMTDFARENSWGDDILAVEFQYLNKHC